MDFKNFFSFLAKLRGKTTTKHDIQDLGDLLINVGANLRDAPEDELDRVAEMCNASLTMWIDVLMAFGTAVMAFNARVEDLEEPEELAKAMKQSFDNSDFIDKFRMEESR